MRKCNLHNRRGGSAIKIQLEKDSFLKKKLEGFLQKVDTVCKYIFKNNIELIALYN